MEEEKKTTNPSEKNEVKKTAAKKTDKKKNDKKSLSEKAADCKAEFKKIIWPNRETVRKNTITVICTSLIIGVIIFGMDTVYTTVINLIVGLLG